MVFLDTNILLYAISGDPAEAAKARRARALLQAPGLVLSVQVLQEFYVQATRPSRRDALSHEEACALIHLLQRFRIVPLTVPLMEAALRIREQHQISYWDAAILAAAAAAGCREVLSEDLSPDCDYNGLRVVNPFAPPQTEK